MRNRRVPKTSSIIKPTVGALTQTDTAANKITRTGGVLTYPDFLKAIDPEVINQVKPKPTRVIAPEKEGETIDITPETETQTQTQTGRRTERELKKLKPTKIKGYLPPESKKKTETPPETQTDSDKPPKPPKGTAVGAGDDRPKKTDAFSSIRKFAKKNPQIAAAGGLAAYDLGKCILSKIMKLITPSVQGGRAIQVSAKQ